MDLSLCHHRAWHSKLRERQFVMSATVDLLDPKAPRRVLLIASNPTVSKQTGFPIGFWWSELTHPYWTFREHGYTVDIASPDGGVLRADSWSDPRDASGYSADDLISLGFMSSPEHAKLIETTISLASVDASRYDAVMLIGGQGPMYTFIDNEPLHRFVAAQYDAGKITALICHATCALLKIKLSDGSLLVKGKTWTGFANSEEDYADAYVGRPIQPFRIQNEAAKITETNFIVAQRFKPFAVRDGLLITGQQQYSGARAAHLVIEALGQ